MKYLKKVCAQDKIIVALNADKDKYLNYKTTNSGIIGNVCMRWHDIERLESFGVRKIQLLWWSICESNF